MDITDKKITLETGQVSIPISFVYDIEEPTLHQEMLAYVLLHNIDRMSSALFDLMQPSDTIAKVVGVVDETLKDSLQDGVGDPLLNLVGSLVDKVGEGLIDDLSGEAYLADDTVAETLAAIDDTLNAAYIDPESGDPYLSMQDTKNISIVFPYQDSVISYRGE